MGKEVKDNPQSCEVFYLNGLNCAHCAGKIEESLKHNDNFKNVDFSFATKKLVVENIDVYGDSMAIITDTVNAIEDGVSVVKEAQEEAVERENFWTKVGKLANTHKYTIVGFVLLVVVMSLGESVKYRLPLYLGAYVLIGGDVVYRAFRNILKGDFFDENFLMSIATFGAFALGEYVEAVAVMLFYKVGEGFQDYAVDHTRRNIKSLLNIKAEYANLVKGRTTEKVDPKELKVGDTVMIKPGEKVPVDVRIISGNSTVDTSALTGESLPVSVATGSEVLSGAINLDAVLTAKVEKEFKNSTVAKIMDMVENATGKKAKTEQFITKFAKIYTPVVVFLAIALAVFPPLLGMGSFADWVSRSLIFLVISCPCALVLSVPLGYFGGLGAASRYGILVKGGNYLEVLNSVDTFVFDKTGTLTKGKFSVVDKTNEEVLTLAAKIEKHSNHPIATSILTAYGQEVSVDEVIEVKEIPGEGLIGTFNGKMLIAGNAKLMKRHNVSHEESSFIGTIVHIAYDNVYKGAIYIADEIKESAKTLAPKLKAKNNSEVVMLTGDLSYIADEVGSKVQIDKVHSELLPGDKLEHVEEYIQKGRTVLFAGDGINDAPVLARADVGVAMGGVGSDAAIEAADMVIMNDDPSKILSAITIAKKTRTIVMQNIIFALGIKLFFLALGATGNANMYEAIFADVGVALLAVLNSMRTLRIKA